MFTPSFAMNLLALGRSPEQPILLSDNNPYPDAHGPEYISKTASEKQDQLWEQVEADKTMGNWLRLPFVFEEGMAETFDSPGDDMPCYWWGCRQKTIHGVGVVHKIKFETVDAHPFTGAFKRADYGLMRMSTAAPYTSVLPFIVPGMGIKFLRDGVDSANTVAMYSVDGQFNWDYFLHDWSNHIPDIQSTFLNGLANKFHEATEYI